MVPAKKKKKTYKSNGLNSIIGAIDENKHDKFKLKMKLKDNIDEH